MASTPLNFSIVSDEAFREIFHSMSEGIIMVDEDGVIKIANSVAEQIFGYEHSELNGLLLENLLPQRYRGGHVNFRRAFSADPSPRRMGFGRDLTALKKDGSEFPVEISLSYTKMKGSLLVMAFISDISQRKKAEDALKRSEEQLIVYATELEKKVELRTEALNQSILTLEREVAERKKAEEEVRKSLLRERELNELKSKFVSIASHEFRTPLSTILSSASLVQQYLNRQEIDKVEKHVARIKSSVNHLTGILNDFLSLGKLEEGKVDVQRERINVDEFCAEIKEELQPTLKSGQNIIVSVDDKNFQIDSDPRILRNILFNLLSNASKYSEEQKQITLQFKVTESSIIFSIVDEGIGIPLEDHKYLFDRFFRASNASNVQGTGLGLNIVKRYVELLAGKIDFTSVYGKGSSFIVTIPR
jgi:PAS domain S-box-containing protein